MWLQAEHATPKEGAVHFRVLHFCAPVTSLASRLVKFNVWSGKKMHISCEEPGSNTRELLLLCTNWNYCLSRYVLMGSYYICLLFSGYDHDWELAVCVHTVIGNKAQQSMVHCGAHDIEYNEGLLSTQISFSGSQMSWSLVCVLVTHKWPLHTHSMSFGSECSSTTVPFLGMLLNVVHLDEHAHI